MTGEILIGCSDGKLIHYDKERTKSISDPSCVCSVGVEHGRIIKIHFNHHSKLLIIGFDHGRIHIKKCTQGLRNSLFGASQWRECCCTLSSSIPSLSALECFSLPRLSSSEHVIPCNPPHLEVWCGTNSDEIEVWTLSVDHNTTWNTETVNQIRKLHKVPLRSLAEVDGVSVKVMSPNDDRTQMAVVLVTPDAQNMIAIVDVTAKKCLKSLPFNQSGMFNKAVASPDTGRIMY